MEKFEMIHELPVTALLNKAYFRQVHVLQLSTVDTCTKNCNVFSAQFHVLSNSMYN